MQACPACGTTNADTQKFCGECGARLAAQPVGEEQRKTVTVLFSDVTGSTTLGERLEPESLRRVLSRFFETAKGVIERHGGTVEKFIGDAVMAVFGVPVVHEDDAVRALRAAWDLMAELAQLNPALEHEYGATLQIRIGVNTGEVVTGTSERLATGDAVNVAARLEQLATPGEIYVGEVTAQLAQASAQLQELEPASLKGKAAPVRVFRLAALTEGGRRTVATPLVGRSRQLDMLRGAFEQTVADRACVLVTVLGAAGVGKSRLVAEFLDGLDALVVRGRCLSYGNGVGLLPAGDIVRALQSGPAGDKVAKWLASEPSVDASLRPLIDGQATVKSANEIAWGFRRLLEHVAEDSPVVAVFDDLHWAEPPLFDLVEHLVTLSRDAPVMVLVMARPELLERRDGWGAGALNSSTALLEPLGADDTATLIDALAPNLDGSARERVLSAAAGNPLFAEEMVAYLEAAGDPGIRVPPTIQALLAARLDQLDPAELRCLERGSIEGQSFHRSAVSALTPDDDDLSQRLLSLVRKDLLRPDRATLDRDEAFRFRHLLLRDAAYERLPKSVRADLHERFARWLDDHAPDLAERDHLVGYHLEQAYHYLAGLGPLDDESRALAAEAAARLLSASRAQMRRQDFPSAIDLIDRAAALEPDTALDVPLQLGAAWAQMLTGHPREAYARTTAAGESARRVGDRVGALLADLVRGALSQQLPGTGSLADLERLLDSALPEIEASGDDAALAWGAWVHTFLAHNACRFGDALDGAIRCEDHARRYGDVFLANHGAFVHAYITLGPIPIPEALVMLEERRGGRPGVQPSLDQFTALLLAHHGHHEEAQALQDRAVDAFRQRGMSLSAAMIGQGGWEIAMARGDIAAAVEIGINSCEALERMHERPFQSTMAEMLAESLFLAGRVEESREWAQRGLDLGDEDDDVTQARANVVLALVAAHGGDQEDARRLVGKAIELIEPMQAPQMQGAIAMRAGDVHRMLGDTDLALVQYRNALDYFTVKDSTVDIERAKAALTELTQNTP